MLLQNRTKQPTPVKHQLPCPRNWLCGVCRAKYWMHHYIILWNISYPLLDIISKLIWVTLSNIKTNARWQTVCGSLEIFYTFKPDQNNQHFQTIFKGVFFIWNVYSCVEWNFTQYYFTECKWQYVSMGCGGSLVPNDNPVMNAPECYQALSSSKLLDFNWRPGPQRWCAGTRQTPSIWAKLKAHTCEMRKFETHYVFMNIYLWFYIFMDITVAINCPHVYCGHIYWWYVNTEYLSRCI